MEYSFYLGREQFDEIEKKIAEKGRNSVFGQIDTMIKQGGRNDFLNAIQLDPLETQGLALDGKVLKGLKGFSSTCVEPGELRISWYMVRSIRWTVLILQSHSQWLSRAGQ